MGIFDFFKNNKKKRKEEKKTPKSKLRVNWDDTEYVGKVTHYRGKPFTGVCFGLYDNGGLDEESEIVDGLMHGLYLKYDDNGKLAMESNYKMGEIDGLSKTYHENGQVHEEGNVIVDKRDGFWKYYFEDGQLQYEGYWKMGIQDGFWKFYFENGVLKNEGSYSNGKKDGLWKSYDENGKLVKEVLLHEDRELKPVSNDEKELKEAYGSKTDRDLIHKLFREYQQKVTYGDINKNPKFHEGVVEILSQIIKIVEKNRDKFPGVSKPIITFAPEDKSYNFNIVDLYYLRGCAKFSTSNKDALNDFNAALLINPNQTEVLYNRAVFYNNVNNDQESAMVDILKCLSLKPEDKDFIKFHEDLSNATEEKLSESEFLEIQSIYDQACFHYSPLKIKEDTKKEHEILTSHFNKEFNKFYNYDKGVVWEKIPGHGMVTIEPTEELNLSISKLSNYHKNKICDIIIDMICVDGETTKLEMYGLFLYFKVSGCSMEEMSLESKWTNKIGYFPDIREWDEDQTYSLINA